MGRNGTHALEARIGLIGREIFARARRAEPSPLAMAWWQRRLLDWVMTDERLKVQLFRFIESLPRLRGSRAVASHLRQYLRDGYHGGQGLPLIIDFITAYSSDTTLLARTAAFAARVGAKQMAGQFIAGATAPEAIATVRRLRRQRKTFTLDVLGETVLCSQDAEHFQRLYLDLIDAMAASAPQWPAEPLLDDSPFGPLPRVNVSIKLSALAGKFDPIASEKVAAVVIGRLRPILEKARRRGVFVNVDTESFAVKDLTFDIFMRVMSLPEFRDWADVGVVVQAYLRDSETDLLRLLDWVRRRGTPITVRLVKGAYWDYETTQARLKRWPIPVWTEKWQSDRQYEKLTAIMLDNYAVLRPAFASHNVRSLAAVLAMSEQRGLPPRTVEAQMLYGMGEPLMAALVEMQQRVRIYTPFGELMPGMAYFIRRLLENTANESFLRQSFSEGLPEQVLLAAPGSLDRAPLTPLPGFRASGPEEDETMTPFENEPDIDFASTEARELMTAALREAARHKDAKHAALIDGRRVVAEAWIECRNPSRPVEIVGRAAACSPQQADQAVEAAARAWRSWSAESPRHRAAVLGEAAVRLRRNRFALAAALIVETGRTWREATAEVATAIDAMEFYGREVVRLTSHARTRGAPGETNEYTWQSRGVVAALTPCTQALATPAHMLAAALAAGNAVVFKPGRAASGVAARLVELMVDAGVPAGAINLVFGDAAVGKRMAAHALVSVVSIAGRRDAVRSTPASVEGSTTHKRAVVQSNGIGTVIVDDDTDVDEAVQGTLASAFAFAGQSPVACSRAVVIGDAYADFVRRLTAAAREASVGPADHPASGIGPLIDAEAREHACKIAMLAARCGRCVVDREHADAIRESGGHYFGPMVFVDVPADAEILRAEVAAPILFVTQAADLSAALAIAHDSPYATTGVFYSRSPTNVARVRAEFRAGALFINRAAGSGIIDRQPVGGAGLAGTGRPPGGPDYLREFLDGRIVSENVMRHGLVASETEDAQAAMAH